MTWVKVCDNFDTDRRIEDVSLEATGLFIRSVAYFSALPARWGDRREMGATSCSEPRKRQKLVEELIDADLWRPHTDGYELVPVRNGDVDHLVSHLVEGRG
jgi:hypothetical protein